MASSVLPVPAGQEGHHADVGVEQQVGGQPLLGAAGLEVERLRALAQQPQGVALAPGEGRLLTGAEDGELVLAQVLRAGHLGHVDAAVGEHPVDG